LQARYDLTLAILLRLKRTRVFDFICSHHLMPLLKGQAVTQLLGIDTQRATRLLVDYHEEAPPGVVTPAIQVFPFLPPPIKSQCGVRASHSTFQNRGLGEGAGENSSSFQIISFVPRPPSYELCWLCSLLLAAFGNILEIFPNLLQGDDAEFDASYLSGLL
jgi:hypothetical protein